MKRIHFIKTLSVLTLFSALIAGSQAQAADPLKVLVIAGGCCPS